MPVLMAILHHFSFDVSDMTSASDVGQNVVCLMSYYDSWRTISALFHCQNTGNC